MTTLTRSGYSARSSRLCHPDPAGQALASYVLLRMGLLHASRILSILRIRLVKRTRRCQLWAKAFGFGPCLPNGPSSACRAQGLIHVSSRLFCLLLIFIRCSCTDSITQIGDEVRPTVDPRLPAASAVLSLLPANVLRMFRAAHMNTNCSMLCL